MKAMILLIFHDFFSLDFNVKIGQKLIQLIKGSPFTPFWTNFGQKIPQKLAKMVYFSVKIPRGPRNKIPGDGEF